MKKTSYGYLVALVKVERDLADQHVEFSEYVRNQLSHFFNHPYAAEISYVEPVELEQDVEGGWKEFFENFPSHLIRIHYKQTLADYPEMGIFGNCVIHPFELVEGRILAGMYFAARSLFGGPYKQSKESGSVMTFLEYLRFVGFPIETLAVWVPV